ncbi:MAG: right-handed parallel beta-helix repeat-containing protein [Planctomycetota bacterium]|nr:right-handed parallel beta-helix repeat-containing protein [Planctomycetota bacterium]
MTTRSLAWCLLLVLATAARAGETLFVDLTLGEASTSTYDPATRKAGGGKEQAYNSLNAAAQAATAGQTVILREGTYKEALAPANSGQAGKYITFKAYEKEIPLITGEKLFPAVQLTDRSYIALEGLHVEKVAGWLHAVRSQRLLLKNNVFRQAHSPGGSSKTGLFFQQAHDNRIVGNTIDDTNQDNLALVKSDRNLVEGNVFLKAKHVLWTIKGGNFNAIRRNYLHNEIQKIGEVFDCEHVGFDHEFTENNCTKHNLIELNVFAHTASSGDHSPFAGIQYAGQDGLIRRNVFYDCIGPALDLTLYPQEALHNAGNRVCHNTFYKNHFAGMILAGRRDDPKYRFEDNVLKNNVSLGTRFQRNDTRWEWYKELDGKPIQFWFGAPSGFLFERNLLFNTAKGEKYLIVQGSRQAKSNPPAQDVAAWQSQFPDALKETLEADPQFVDGEKRDFHLKSGSPAIDAGAFLTRAKGDGQGVELTVVDAGWFCDGYGIEGLAGDEIQFEGADRPVQIVKVDFAKQTLTLKEPAAWKDGQGVSLAFSGQAPDLGAYEHGGPEAPAAPAPPAQ